jgi:transposase
MQALAERRRRAVKLREKGMLVNDVARECELSHGTVIVAHKTYCLGDWAGMALKPHGRSTGVGRRLNAEQESEAQKLIRDKPPDQTKMPFKIKLPVWTVGAYLARWGFIPQKPKRKLTSNAQSR